MYPSHTPSQVIKTTESSLPWQQPGHWAEGSSTSLQPHVYAAHSSFGATHSQYSDSAWETVPSTPSADDSDLRPIPDNNSASMQSYNDPRIGIWPQENTYLQVQTYMPLMGTHHDHGNHPAVKRLVPQKLQEVFANADAATPFGTKPHPKEDPLFVNVALGTDGRAGMAAPSFQPPPVTAGPVSQFSQLPNHGRSETLLAIKGTMNQTSLLTSRGQKTTPNIALSIALDNSPFPATDSPPAVCMDPPASTLSRSASAGPPITGVAKCTHRGCGAKFKGVSRKDTLRRHKLNVHGNKQKPICPECHLVIQSGRRDNWKRHITDQHPGHPILESLDVRGKKIGSTKAVPREPAEGETARQPA